MYTYCIQGRDTEKLRSSPKYSKPPLQDHLQLKTTEDSELVRRPLMKVYKKAQETTQETHSGIVMQV